MTKKNYIAAVKIIQDCFKNPSYDKEAIINIFIRFFENDNENFDKIRFREACYEKK